MNGRGPAGPGPAPRWFWLLPVIAIVAWWPHAPYWQSDDFFALHYARDFGHVLHDFVGPQYGATDTWWFYRPLITLSFWCDQLLGGASPTWSFWSNVLAHATSTVLAGLIWRRFLGDGQAFAAAALWAVMPSHLGSIAWAVGRVDSHTTVWCLLTAWLCLRHQEGARRSGAIAIAATTALALASKELALVLPALAALAVWCRAPGGMRARAAAARRVTAPAWLVLLAYLPLRVLALGRFGGYAAATYEPMSMLRGLGLAVERLLVPLTWIGQDHLPGECWPWLWASAAPVLVAVALALGRRGVRFVAATAGAFLVATSPMAAILPLIDDPQTLRNYYLPALLLTGLCAAGGRAVAAVIFVVWAYPLGAALGEQRVIDRESAAMHHELLRLDGEAPQGPLFVAGMPHASPHAIAVQLHFGIDRMLRLPFVDSGRRLYALRPLAEPPLVSRLFATNDAAWALPAGTTWTFAGPTSLRAASPPPPLPPLVVTGDDHGVFDFSTPRLERLERGETFALTTDVRAPWFRFTVFTASGYLACLFTDHAADGSEGRIDALRLLAGSGTDKALYAPGTANLGDALTVPATLDLDLDFPLLIEAGTFDPGTLTFTPTHRATRLLRLRVDRGYPAWVRRVQAR